MGVNGLKEKKTKKQTCKESCFLVGHDSLPLLYIIEYIPLIGLRRIG